MKSIAITSCFLAMQSFSAFAGVNLMLMKNPTIFTSGFIDAATSGLARAVSGKNYFSYQYETLGLPKTAPVMVRDLPTEMCAAAEAEKAVLNHECRLFWSEPSDCEDNRGCVDLVPSAYVLSSRAIRATIVESFEYPCRSLSNPNDLASINGKYDSQIWGLSLSARQAWGLFRCGRKDEVRGMVELSKSNRFIIRFKP